MKRQRGWYNGSGRATKRVRTGIYVSPVVVNRRPAPRRRTYTRRFTMRTGGVRAQTETKYFTTGFNGAVKNLGDGDWTDTEVDPAGNSLFSPAPGSAYNQREGKKVWIKKIKIKGHFIREAYQGSEDEPTYGSSVRFVLYMDKQTNGVQSQGEQVIGSAATAGGAIDAFQNIDNFGRFKVLKDKTITFSNPNFGWDGTEYDSAGDFRHFKITKNFTRYPLKVDYNTGGNANISDVVDNSFHLLAGCMATGGQVHQLVYTVRVVFCE